MHLCGLRRSLGDLPKLSGVESQPQHWVLRGPWLVRGGGHTERCKEMEKGRAKTLLPVTIFFMVPQSRFSLFFLLWEMPHSQMKNLGKECGFPVQSPVTKSVNKVRTRGYSCEDFCFLLFPSQTHYCSVRHKI